jgi:phosphohistidine phosphatase SixA
MVVAALTTWLATRTHIVDLGNEQQLSDSGLCSNGDGAVIVMIRHAERCDSAPAMPGRPHRYHRGRQRGWPGGPGPAPTGPGRGDLLSSPKLRTRQTAHFMLGQALASEDWLETCDKQFATKPWRKRSGHNLVLVTHNGCIDHFARQQHVAGASAKAAMPARCSCR